MSLYDYGKKNDKVNSQVPWEIDIEAVPNGKVIGEQLQRDDVQQALQAVDGLGHADRLAALGNAPVVLVADDDWLCLARGDLRVRGLHLGVERVLCHDDDNGHVLVNERKGAVLQLAGKDTLGVHV